MTFVCVFCGFLLGCSKTGTLFILLIVYVIVKVLNLNMNQNVDIIDAASSTPASIVIFDPIDIGSCQISESKGNLIHIQSGKTIASLACAIPIKHTNEIKYESSQSASQTQS